MEYFQPTTLLKKEPPTLRAAYSDRTAWLMAELSALAYFRFEPEGENLIEFASRMKGLDDDTRIRDLLAEFLKSQTALSDDGVKRLEGKLNVGEFKLVKPFNKGGTQGFLVKRDSDNLAVLAFRGTEATQIADIKADLNAIITVRGGHRIHTGFFEAYQQVQNEVEEAVAGVKDYALYVTGHSLGGALALIATRELAVSNLAACYTYGSPRVGSSEFGDPIKTPIYRIVNTADVVPRLPPGVAIELIVDLLRFFKHLLPALEYVASWLDDKVSGYRHHGDMRYLTNCKQEDCSDVRLIPNITFFGRLQRLIKNRLSFNRRISDHSIDEYRRKLAAYAEKRTRTA